jgi:excisionase family DNA binding protein
VRGVLLVRGFGMPSPYPTKPATTLDGEPALTPKQIADRTGRARQGVYQSIANGDLKATRDASGQWLVKVSDFADWLAKPSSVRGLKERWALYREWRQMQRGGVA